MTTEQLVSEFQRGAVNAIDDLFNDCKGMIYKIIYVATNSREPENYLGEATLALMRATKRYRPGKVAFKTFCWSFIWGSVKNQKEQEDRDQHEFAPVYKIDVEAPQYDRSIEALHNALASAPLTVDEYVVMMAYFGLNDCHGAERRSVRAVAKRMQKSQFYIRNVLMSAIEKLRSVIE